MKKLYVLGIALLCLSTAKAQFLPFRVDVMFGAAIPQGSGSKGGVLFGIEPKYAVMKHLSVGLRLEAALTAQGYYNSAGQTASASVAALGSYLATADYYLPGLVFRPFVGGGVGVYDLAKASFSGSVSDNTQSQGAASKVGGMTRVGFEAAHFRLALEYNFIGSSNTVQVNETTGDITTYTSKNSYAGIKLGFFIGGGRR